VLYFFLRRKKGPLGRGPPSGRSKRSVIQVKVKRGEPVDKALKRLKKALDKEGLMREIRSRRYFEKPSEIRRRELARARARARLQAMES